MISAAWSKKNCARRNSW